MRKARWKIDQKSMKVEAKKILVVLTILMVAIAVLVSLGRRPVKDGKLWVSPTSFVSRIYPTPLLPAGLAVIDGPKDVVSSRVELINTAQEWEKVRGELQFSTEAGSLSDVDFAKESLVVVYAGRREMGGNLLNIESIKNYGNRLVIEAILTTPGKDCLGTSYYTSPIAFAVIPKASAKVKLALKEEEKPCSLEKRLHVPLPL